MDFSNVDGKLTVMEHKAARARFDWLLTELGIRDTNEHVGTGLGGNNFQLLVLMCFEHRLVHDKKITIQVEKDHIKWGAPWLTDTKKKEIRWYLNEIFPAIKEKKKYLAVAMEALSGSGMLRDKIIQHSEQFPRLVRALEGKTYRFQRGLSGIDQLILAFVMCQELSDHLDQDDTSLVQPIGAALADFPMEVILLSVRRFVGIERLVKWNLDEDPVFGKMLTRINRVVDK